MLQAIFQKESWFLNLQENHKLQIFLKDGVW